MLIKAKTLTGYKLDGYDGEIGKVMEFYFDDRHWAIRYLVADTGNWLIDRQVLISPYALVEVVPQEEHITVNLTKKQIEESPSLDSDKPVSQQFEEDYYGYYEWPMYWAGPFMWGAYPYIERDGARMRETSPDQKKWDPHLRSTQEVSDYQVQATDGVLGHIAEFIIDDETWAIRYLVINTDTWWPGKRVLVSTQWIERVSWSESTIFTTIPREKIKLFPEYTDDSLLNRQYEQDLHRHYDFRGYWID